MSHAPFVVTPAEWGRERDRLRAVRRAVFIDEQHVPEALEWDDVDAEAYHVLALAADGEPIGTGRLTCDGRIGRMAVVKPWRGRGVGAAILRMLIAAARTRRCTVACLHAQTHAIGFYEKHGFVVNGDPFEEAGIPHRSMSLRL